MTAQILTIAGIAPRPLKLICDFEGYHKLLPDGRAAPYLCPARVPTIGYGSIYRLDGSRVALEDLPITRDMAAQLLARELTRACIPAVRRLITVPLPDDAFGALVSFTYNLGSGALRQSNLRRVVNAKRWAEVPREFAKWRMAGGVVLKGLERRRKAEAEMFLSALALARSDTPATRREARGFGSWSTSIQRAA